jgi:hypothetical protein
MMFGQSARGETMKRRIHITLVTFAAAISLGASAIPTAAQAMPNDGRYGRSPEAMAQKRQADCGNIQSWMDFWAARATEAQKNGDSAGYAEDLKMYGQNAAAYDKYCAA